MKNSRKGKKLKSVTTMRSGRDREHVGLPAVEHLKYCNETGVRSSKKHSRRNQNVRRELQEQEQQTERGSKEQKINCSTRFQSVVDVGSMPRGRLRDVGSSVATYMDLHERRQTGHLGTKGKHGMRGVKKEDAD
jgi:hypothetical protein